MADQLPLFGFRDMRPKTRVPISEEKIREAQRLLNEKKGKEAAKVLRDVRYGLENYCKRINQKP